MNYVTNDQAYGFFSKVSEDFADVNGKIPSNASSGNKMVTASDIATKADLVDGKVPAAQLPSFVDDVLEYASTSAFPATGESGKIYVALDTNKTYRWGGSDYVEISESLALGETSSTAYAGDKGKANADAISDIQDLIPSGASTSNKLATASDIPDTSGLQPKTLATTIGSYTTVEGALSGINDAKVDKVQGKGLSTNDYTDADQTALQTTIPLEISQLQGSLLEKFPRAEQRVLGAKNFFDKELCERPNVNTTVTQTSNGVRGVVSNATTWSSIVCKFDNPKENTDFILTDYANITSGRALQKVSGSNDGSSYTTIKEANALTASGNQEMNFNSGNYRYLKIDLYITGGTGYETGDITYENILLRLAIDPDDTYVPYAMTNRELTEEVAKTWSDFTTINLTGTNLEGYGTLKYSENLFTDTAIIVWEGNSTAPSTDIAGSVSNIPLTRASLTGIYTTMRRGDQIGISGRNVTVRLTAGQSWSSGYVMFPIFDK